MSAQNTQAYGSERGLKVLRELVTADTLFSGAGTAGRNAGIPAQSNALRIVSRDFGDVAEE
jgi:hypothetical protein